MIFFLEGRPVSGVRKFKCMLKKTRSFCPCSRAFNRSSKGLICLWAFVVFCFDTLHIYFFLQSNTQGKWRILLRVRKFQDWLVCCAPSVCSWLHMCDTGGYVLQPCCWDVQHCKQVNLVIIQSLLHGTGDTPGWMNKHQVQSAVWKMSFRSIRFATSSVKWQGLSCSILFPWECLFQIGWIC